MVLVGEFEIRGLPKTTNSGGRSHWSLKVKEANKWKSLVGTEVLKLGLDNLKLNRAVLTLTRHSSVEPDFDGLVSSFKHVIDGLVVYGVLTSDKSSVIGQPKYFWEYGIKRVGGKISVKIERPA